MNRATRITVAAVALALPWGGGPAAAQTPAGITSFRSAGRCLHLSAALRVDAAAAAEIVPLGFTVLEPAPGVAVGALVTQDCQTSVDGGPSARSFMSVAFIFLNPLLSPAGCQNYDLFWTSSEDDAWHRAMRALDVRSEVVPDSRVVLTREMVGESGRAVNPFPEASYAYAASTSGNVTPRGPLVSVHCQVGERGLVRQTYDHDFSGGIGTAQIQLGQSELWTRLGAQAGPSAGLVARFTWTGVTEVVPETEQ